MTDAKEFDLLAWILRKWEIPEDATDIQILGAMNVAHSDAHGYRTYIVAHRCEDKQGEIARLAVRVKELEDGIRAEVGEIPEHVVVREDGADEDVLASLAVSVGKLKNHVAELDEQIDTRQALDQMKARVKELELLLRQANDLRESAGGCEQRMALRVEEAEAIAKAAVCGLQEISAGLHPDPGLRAQEILTMVGAPIYPVKRSESLSDADKEAVRRAITIGQMDILGNTFIHCAKCGWRGQVKDAPDIDLHTKYRKCPECGETQGMRSGKGKVKDGSAPTG